MNPRDSSASPKVSIGLPVYNGAKFLRQTLDALLGQTFADLEVVISDNASTDKTEAICREYAARDDRVRYVRSPVNRGAAWNYNRLLELATGEYFKWAAHDDLPAATFIERCVAVLDADPTLVLCHTHCAEIDEQGQSHPHQYNDAASRLDPTRAPAEQFGCVLHSRYAWIRVFGLARLAVLRQTPGIGPFVASDLVLMAELALRGPMDEVPEELFQRRLHPETSVQACRQRRRRLAWFDGRASRVTCLPEWRLMGEYFKLVWWRAPATLGTRGACSWHLLRKAGKCWRALVLDLVWALQDIIHAVREKTAVDGEARNVDNSIVCDSALANDRCPDVSVLMTVYNGEQHLTAAVQSILDQQGVQLELVVVNDGSTDATRQLLERFAQDARVQVIHSDRIGRVAALNRALQAAQGRYVAVLDADDVALPDRLMRQVDFLRRNPQVGLLGSACRVVDETTGREWIRRHPLDDKTLRQALVRENSFIHSAVMMPRAVLAELGGYQHQYRKCHDYELYVRIGRRYQLANLPQVLVVKRVHHQAAFRFGFPAWRAYRERATARWQAWRSFSRALGDLPYVAEPLWRYVKSTLRRLLLRVQRLPSKMG